MFLSRLRPTHAATILQEAVSQSSYGYHQLVWRIFSDGPNRDRDFLYRLDFLRGSPVIYALSQRVPVHRLGWHVESKGFEPALQAGDRLQFSLRANATRSVAVEPGARGSRHDVVMHEKKLRRERGEEIHMPSLVQEAGVTWLASRAEKSGVSIEAAAVEAYQQHRFRKPDGGPEVRFSTLDFQGILEVQDVRLFHDTLRNGIGATKGFGNGLLLIRRAP